MPVQDRTNEFRACVESIRNRSSIPRKGDESRQRLLQSQGKVPGSKSEFSRMASAIAKDISNTTIKLGKLAQCEFSPLVRGNVSIERLQWQGARRFLMTDQSRLVCVHPTPYRVVTLTLRIQELTYIIKQDIANINKQIAALQSYVKQQNATNAQSAEGKQLEEHNHNVVMLLQSKLADTSMSFKDVLEIRTQVSQIGRASSSWLALNDFSEYEGIEGPHRSIYAFNVCRSQSSTNQSGISLQHYQRPS